MDCGIWHNRSTIGKIIESIYLRSQWGKVKAEESKEI